MRPIGVIKIGTSNTAILAATDLGMPIVQRGCLIDLGDPTTWTTLTQTLAEYTGLLKQSGVQYGLVSGGEALRKNEALRQHIQNTGLPFWPVTPALEGRLTWLAVKAERADVSTVIDVGGGSTEVITERSVASIPIGAAQKPQQAVLWPPLTGRGGITALVGGTATALHMLAGEALISRPRLLSLLDKILADPVPSVLQDFTMARQRLVVGGSQILRDLLRFLDSPEFVIAHRGFIEGLWLAASLGRARSL